MIYNDLALFISVARTENFAKAATELNIPPSRMSRRIADLETHLGIKLFERTTRQVRLTEEGRALLDRCQAPMETLEGISGFGETLKAQTIRITAASLAARRTIAPKLLTYMKAYPQVKVELITANQRLDFIRDNIDVAFRLGPLPDSDLIARYLWDVPYSFCASRDFLNSRSLPTKITKQTMLDQPAIASAYGWLLEGGSLLKPKKIKHMFDDLQLIEMTAREHMGIALLPADMITDNLVALDVSNCKPALRTMHIVYPEKRLLPQRVRDLIKHFSA
ncbi:LysR family transcriptional regulator [Kordiimonas sp. SCSIO 12603]|uniref:LysR family transcriptional regulator n=1 Tax=Kordiimonas sp. SCSIO 12603 TaxID=2829596 RepID=UPI0021046673|nr:LysR family transcriptional regulator [Kordiimonas sp. SCSIO 12603]UTW59385.1 LysR family transcriptional regulator [Kordiimonas sp. SCSIO 12603]